MNVMTSYEVQQLNDYVSERYRLVARPTIVLRALSKTTLGIRRLTSAAGYNEPVGGLPPDKAFLISVHLGCPDGASWQTWMGNKPVAKETWTTGGVGIYDLEEKPAFFRDSAFDCVHYYLPRATLNAFTDEMGWARVETLRSPGGIRDHVLHHLAEIILPVLHKPQMISQPYFEQYLSMLCAYVVSTYGTIQAPNDHVRGGLTSWQRRRVTDLIQNDVMSECGLNDLAEGCELSTSHFARCFKKTFGMPVHRYLIHQRIKRSKDLLLDRANSLSQIALRTGFADQAAFGRTFAAVVGETPAKWRKEHLHVQRLNLEGESNDKLKRLNVTSGFAP
jgi:AraC family transcriptional regulator